MGAQRVAYRRSAEEILMSVREHLASLETVLILPTPPQRTRVRSREGDGLYLALGKAKIPRLSI